MLPDEKRQCRDLPCMCNHKKLGWMAECLAPHVCWIAHDSCRLHPILSFLDRYDCNWCHCIYYWPAKAPGYV